MLTADQRGDFERNGFVRLEGALDASEATAMADLIWQTLAREHDIDRADPASWTVGRPTGFQSLTRDGAFSALQAGMVGRALDDLLGEAAWGRTERLGAPLVTFPVQGGVWNVPDGQWHLDFPARGMANVLPGIRLLAFVAPVAPRSGGTLVIAGSHALVTRLVEAGEAGDGRSADVRRKLARSSGWLRALWSTGAKASGGDRVERFMDAGGEVDGVAVRVVELTGSPGDVVLMHPWIYHAGSTNCGDAPRIMISHSVFRTAAPRG